MSLLTGSNVTLFTWLAELNLVDGHLLAAFDWVQFIIRTGITLGVIVVGLYLVMAVKDWMQTPQEYSTAGDDLESLREALQLGSIDEEEYRRAVHALKTMNDRLAPKEVADLKNEIVDEQISAASFIEVKSKQPSEESEGSEG